MTRIADSAGTEEPAQAGPVAWLELFFDLVVIAGIAVLSEGLREDPTLTGLGVYLVLFGAIWFTWISVVLYADVAGVRTHTRTVLVTMLLVAVMAASSPSHFEHRANAFAIAFLIGRSVVARSAMRTGQVVAGWPLLQFGGFSVPWIAAMWVDAPAKFWLWGAALLGDLVMVTVRADEVTERHLAELDERAARRGRALAQRGVDAGNSQPPWGKLTPAELDQEHLGERLGIFLIIVLGEAVTQLVAAASGTEWTNHLRLVALAGFAILVGLWSLTFAPIAGMATHVRLSTLPARFGLPLHLFTTLGILLLACGLGELASAADEPFGTVQRWETCSGLALVFAVFLVVERVTGVPRRWLLQRTMPCMLFPLVLASVGADLTASGLAWLLVVPIAWAGGYAWRSGTRSG